jgi:1-acyl-sn-glycerol-3-phosphate acyltransferase
MIGETMSLVRSLLFTGPLIALCTAVMGTISLIASFFDKTGETQHAVARVWAKMLLAITFIRVRVEGIAKIDPSANYVFAANHASYMDIPVILSAISNQFRFFAKKSLFSLPFLGTHLWRAGHLLVDHSGARASLKSMSEGARLIAERHVSVLLFPEGGRQPNGLSEFKEGAAYIAIKAGVPVIPMALIGMRERLPMGSMNMRGGNVVLRIGDPIPTAGLGISDRAELNQRVYSEVARLIGAEDAVTRQV